MFRKSMKLGVILSLASLVLLGIMPIISNSRPLEMGALNFALFLSLWQLIISIPVLLAEQKWGSKGIFNAKLASDIKNKTLIIISITGAIFGLSTFAYVLSVEKAGTTSAAIAFQAYPLFAILLETIFLNRKKNKTELFLTFLLIASLYYLATNGTWTIEGLSYWFVFALSVPLLWSIAHVIIKELLGNTPITPAQITFFRVLISSIILLLISLSVNGSEQIISALGNPVFQKYAAIMGLVYYAELIVWFYAVKHIDVSLASSITTPWPVLTMILAYLFLHETVESYQIITMMLVFVSVYGLVLAGKKKKHL